MAFQRYLKNPYYNVGCNAGKLTDVELQKDYQLEENVVRTNCARCQKYLYDQK